MQELVELVGIDPRDRLLTGDQTLVDHLRSDAQGSRGSSLARSRLQEVERSLLDRELDVLQVAVVPLEAPERLDELLERLRHALAHPVDRLRSADARDDVLALRVREKLAVEQPFARGRVPREADAGARASAAIPEDHLDDVHGGAEVVGNVVRAAVHLRARRVPRVEDRPVSAAQLVAGILRELAAGPLLVDGRERGDELAQILDGEVDVLVDAPRRLEVGERLLEALPVDPVDDLAVHLDEPAIRIEGEALVSGRRREPLRGDVVQAEVEDRVHHPGHRDRRTRADGDEQWIARVAEALPGALLEAGDVLVDLRVEPSGGTSPPSARNARHASVVIVKPSGTGTPSCVISARPIPFPPRSSRPPPESSPKSKT